MGVFASGSVQIYLNSIEDARKVQKMIEGIQQIVEARTKKPAYFELYEIKKDSSSVEFGVSSSRAQNAEWQVEQVIEQLKIMTKSKEISGVVEFTADLMQEYNSWCMDGEEFEEGGDCE